MKIFNFGKYKGKHILDVLNESPSYILWVYDNVDNFKIPDEVLCKANLRISEQQAHVEKYKAYKNKLRRERQSRDEVDNTASSGDIYSNGRWCVNCGWDEPDGEEFPEEGISMGM